MEVLERNRNVDLEKKIVGEEDGLKLVQVLRECGMKCTDNGRSDWRLHSGSSGGGGKSHLPY